MADFELFQIEVSTKYATSEWRSDLKKLLKRAGVDGVNLVFFFNDHQIKDESFLEDINMLLNSSDIPSLFENDERNEIIDKVEFILFYSFYCSKS
jgi:dynein heavy chain